MKKVISILILLLSLIALTQCVTLFGSEIQKISITSNTKDASIYYHDKKQNEEIVEINKTDQAIQLYAKKDGYITKSHASPAFKSAGSLKADLFFPFWGLIAYVFEMNSASAYKFPKKVEIPELTQLPDKKFENEKYLIVNEAAFNIPANDTIILKYSSWKKCKKRSSYGGVILTNKIKINQSIFAVNLQGLLKQFGFTDSSKTIFTDFTNTNYLNAEITKFKVHAVIGNSESKKNALQIELQVKWNVTDYFGTTLTSFSSNCLSDFYAGNLAIMSHDGDSTETTLGKMITSAFEYNLAQEFKKDSFRKLLKRENQIKSKSIKPTILTKTNKAKIELSELKNSSVSIKVKDGHGSGFIISKDGLIISNYHVIANNGSDTIDILHNNGQTSKGIIIQKAPEVDLVLIKINKTDLNPMNISTNKENEVGENVIAIGSPESLELGQSISKGIISGSRKTPSFNYIQTDVNVNSGNSGGALLNEKGEVIGIVTSKLVGNDIEGISFAIPSYLIFEKFNLKYE